MTMDILGEQVDKLVTLEVDHREGDDPTKTSRGKIEALYRGVRNKSSAGNQPLCLEAAKRILSESRKSRGRAPKIIISTGWVIPFWYPHGEMCGMIGTVALTRALVNGLGAKVLFVSEDVVLPVYQGTCSSAGLRVYKREDESKIPIGVLSEEFPIDVDRARERSQSLLSKFEPSAVITLERCARNDRGVYHTGAGNSMSDSTAKVDYLVEEARKQGVLTVGVGDLGNEVGMKVVSDLVKQLITFGDKCQCGCGGGIASAVETDVTVMASSSSRGGYGISACLAGLLKNVELIQDEEMEKRMIQTASSMGAIDSFTVNPTLTDGHALPAEASAHLVGLLRQLVRAEFETFPMYEARENSGG